MNAKVWNDDIAINCPGFGKGKKIKPLCDILLESIIVDAKTDAPIDSALTSVADGTGIINNSKDTNSEGIVEYIFECEDEIQLMVSKDGYESKMIDIKLLDIDPPLLKVIFKNDSAIILLEVRIIHSHFYKKHLVIQLLQDLLEYFLQRVFHKHHHSFLPL